MMLGTSGKADNVYPTLDSLAPPTSLDIPLLSYDAHADNISGITVTSVYPLVPSFENETTIVTHG